MSNSSPAGKLGKATKVLRDHPVIVGLALFVGAATAVRTVVRRNSMFDIELPEATEVPRDENLGDLASVRNDDSPLKDSTQAKRPGDDTDGDPISREIKP